MKKILLASQNNHKYEEFKDILRNFNVELLSLNYFGDHDDIYEYGRTFEENALLKANYYAAKYHLPTIADDSGISIAYFGNLPGVHSARFMDFLDYQHKNDLIIDIMKEIRNRQAHYTAVIAFADEKRNLTFEGQLMGRIACKASGSNGFGYDPIFIPEGYDQTLAQLSPREKNRISHRAAAAKKMVSYFDEKSI